MAVQVRDASCVCVCACMYVCVGTCMHVHACECVCEQFDPKSHTAIDKIRGLERVRGS